MQNNDYHYVGVIFENSRNNNNEPLFNLKDKVYEYKTNKDLKLNEIVEVNTFYGKSRVLIVKDNISESELQFDKDLLKEI